MSTTNGSATGAGSVEKIAPGKPLSSLEQRLGIGTSAEIRDVVDHSRLMEIAMATVPETVEVRWVGINNSHQIERHLQNGYHYVLRTDGIKTIAGLEGTDATGQYIVVGDCVLMGCSKESLRHRHKQIAARTRQRLDATLDAGEFKEKLAANRIEPFIENEKFAENQRAKDS